VQKLSQSITIKSI